MDIMDTSPDTLVLTVSSTHHRFPSTVLFSRGGKELVWIISSLSRLSTTVSHQTSTPTCATPPAAAAEAAEHPPHRRNLAPCSPPPNSSRAVLESKTLVNFTSTVTTAGGCRRLLTAATDISRFVECAYVDFSTFLLCKQLQLISPVL